MTASYAYNGSCASSEDRTAFSLAHYDPGNADCELDSSLDSSMSEFQAISEYDELEATLRLSASLVQDLVVALRVPDKRKRYNRKFSDVVAIFDSLSGPTSSSEMKNSSCNECGIRHGCEGRSSGRGVLPLKGFGVVSALKSLLRWRRSRTELPPK